MSVCQLTFDDGPDPEWTPWLLDLLAEVRAYATFFPIAPRAAMYPEVIARMAAEGHAVGLHCDQHVRHGARDVDWLRQDTATALARLTNLGISPRYWRTPWGETAAWSAQVAQEHGLRMVGWTVDTHDWRGDSAQAMFASTRDRIAPGAIVLAHDGIGPGALRANAYETVRYVEKVAAYAEQRGLRLEALR